MDFFFNKHRFHQTIVCGMGIRGLEDSDSEFNSLISLCTKSNSIAGDFPSSDAGPFFNSSKIFVESRTKIVF